MCDNYSEKIIDFNDLNATEQEEIRTHAESCADCRKKLAEVQTILTSMKHHQAEHVVDDELLERYSVYLAAPDEPDYDGRCLTAIEISAVKNHLNECQHCQQKVERLTREFQEINAYLEETELTAYSLSAKAPESAPAKKSSNFSKKILDTVKNFISLPAPRLYPVAAGTFVVLLVLAWFGPFFRGSDYQYYRLASLEQETYSPVTRSNVSETFSKGLSTFHAKQYQQAIAELERYIGDNPDGSNLFSAHYIAGIAYLTESKSDFLGRFETYDSGQLEKGIQHLQTAETLSDNLGLKEDCYWYLGKAYLMQKGGKNAVEMFQKVVDLRGRRFKEAQEMVREIGEVGG